MPRTTKPGNRLDVSHTRFSAWLFVGVWVIMSVILLDAGVMLSHYLARDTTNFGLYAGMYRPGFLIPFGLLIAGQTLLLQTYVRWSVVHWLLWSVIGLVGVGLLDFMFQSTGYYMTQGGFLTAIAYYSIWSIDWPVLCVIVAPLAVAQAGAMYRYVRYVWLLPVALIAGIMAGDMAYFALYYSDSLLFRPLNIGNGIESIVAFASLSMCTGLAMLVLIRFFYRESVAGSENRVIE